MTTFFPVTFVSPFLDKFVDNNLYSTDWKYVVQIKQLSPRQLKKYARFLDWDLVILHQKLSGDLVKEFAPYIDFSQLATTQFQLSDKDILDGYKAALIAMD